MNLELSYGKNLTSSEERMTSITLTDLYSMIRQADSPLSKQQNILRSILNIDAQKYRNLKKSLPYFVCGKFVTGRRVIDEFASTTSFIIDIDHYENVSKTIEELKEELSNDKRIALIYVSPSGTGLKVLFTLDKPCTDANVYAVFYRQFAMMFAKEHDIIQFVDYKTHDVTRACFLAYDPDCRINDTPDAVSIDNYVNLDNIDLFIKKQKQIDAECNKLSLQDEQDCEAPKPIDPNKETMQRIKSILDTNKRKRIEEENSINKAPSEILCIMDGLKSLLEEVGVELYETRSIQYGIKLMLRSQLLQAEINVFYGKKGYSVVHIPKKGTSQQLGVMLKDLISDYLYGLTE